MAWRIHESVLHGEIDNRTKGVVVGQVWLHGCASPLELRLRGNACADLAGCLLRFRNPSPAAPPLPAAPLPLLQSGTVGDLTASRKVRMPDISLAEFLDWDPAQGPPPEHLGNGLYLEWFSDTRERVVIEGVDWELHISPPEWRLTPEDEAERTRAAAAGMAAFMDRLSAAIDQHQHGRKAPEEEWDEHDYEKFMRECDARTEKYRELLEKYGDAQDGDSKIDEAMGWDHSPGHDEDFGDHDDDPPLEIGDILGDDDETPVVEPDLDPTREGIDWIKTSHGEIRHPLHHRCCESALRFGDRVGEVLSLETAPDEITLFIFEFQTAGVKLGGALDSLAEDRTGDAPAFIVACLKRALSHLHRAQAGLEAPVTQGLLPKELVAEARSEMFAIREAILRLMDEFRGRKQ